MGQSPQEFKRGRGTNKAATVGAVEREPGKRVRLEVMDKLSSMNLLAMLKHYVNQKKVIAGTDELKGYAKFEKSRAISNGETQRKGIRG